MLIGDYFIVKPGDLGIKIVWRAGRCNGVGERVTRRCRDNGRTGDHGGARLDVDGERLGVRAPSVDGGEGDYVGAWCCGCAGEHAGIA